MKKTFRNSLPIPAFFLAFILFSCSNPETKKEESKANEPGSSEFTPFNVMMIKHAVADYAKWRPVYDAHDSVRQAFGIKQEAIARGLEDPNLVLIIERVADIQKAKDFTVLPELKEAMQKAGVAGPPEFSFYNVIRYDETKIDQKDRCMVTHRVKDFDAWLKVYDEEGKAKRMEEGMLDRVMARGIDDPNIVHLVFAITDMAKAKAAINSEEKKKIMMDAGVEGKPDISFFTLEN
jgi:quinol monooxygenase YgiN